MNAIQDKNHIIILTNADKSFQEIQQHFMIKVLKKLGFEGNFLNIIKAVYDKLIVNIILKAGKLRPFSLKSGMRKGCLLSPFLFNIILTFLTGTIRQEKEIKVIQTEKEEVKFSLYADDMII
jgi:hypothetical protein